MIILYFVTFLLLFLSSIFLYILSTFFNKKINNKLLIFTSFLFSIIWSIVLYSKNNFSSISNFQNTSVINILIFSYLIINIFMILFFFITLFSAPFFLMQGLACGNKLFDKNKIAKTLPLIFLLILCFLIVFAFKEAPLSIDMFYYKINNINSEYVNVYLNIKKIINILFKSDWSSWVYISYFIIILLIIYLLQCRHNFFKIKRYNFNWIKNVNLLSIPIAFLSLTSSLLISVNSLLYRLLSLYSFFLLVFLCILLYTKFRKGFNIDDTKGIILSIVYPISYTFFLCLSNQIILNWSSFYIYINMLLTLIFAIAINYVLYFNINMDNTFSRYTMQFNVNYIVNGVNTSLLIYLLFPTEWFLNKFIYNKQAE